MNKQVMLWRAVNDYGFGWLTARFVYEMQVRSGFQTLRFGQRAWAENELSRWLGADVSSDPDDYAHYWREHNGHSFSSLPTAPGLLSRYARH